jgi:hypothetical protein
MWWRSWLRHCATSQKVAGNWNFLLTQSFRPHYDPGVDSASNRNECQEYFLRGKGGRCIVLTTLPPSCADCLEIWEPQLLEPSGPVQACNGIALPFLFEKLAFLLHKLAAVQIKDELYIHIYIYIYGHK